jgi:hypothetical protein
MHGRGEIPDKPRVDRPERQFARSARRVAVDIVEASGAWCRKNRRRGRGGLAREQRRVAAARSSSHSDAVRRSCQRWHWRWAGRWRAPDRVPLVGDADGRDIAGPAPAMASASCNTPDWLAQISVASCSTQPGCGKTWRNSRCATPRMLPSRSNTMARELVVPWSRAMTYCMESFRLPRIVAAA